MDGQLRHSLGVKVAINGKPGQIYLSKRRVALIVIETSSQESCGGTREFYLKIGCTLTAQIPDFYDQGDDKLIYLKPIRQPAGLRFPGCRTRH